MDWGALGKKVKELRLKRGLSLRALAEQAGVAHSFIAGLEEGSKTRPSLDHIEKIARALGVSFQELAGEVAGGGERRGETAEVEGLHVKLLRIGEIDRELGRDRLAQLSGVIEAVMEQAERDYLEERRAERRRRSVGEARQGDKEA